MKIVVIDRSDSWHVNDLVRAAGNQHSITTSSYDDISAAIEGEGTSRFVTGGLDASQIDCILTRAMPAASLEQVVFRMDWLARLQQQHEVTIVNPAKTIEASVDKYLSLELMRTKGVPVPQTMVSQNVAVALQHFEELGGRSVVKPIFGSGGRRISLVKNKESAKECFAAACANEKVIYQQRYIEHGDSDIRLFTIGDRVFGMRRSRPGEWITNVAQGARCTVHDPNPLETELALQAAQAVGALISGVDLVYDESGTPFVVEINACPAWKAFSQTTGIDIAREILEFVAQIRGITSEGTSERFTIGRA